MARQTCLLITSQMKALVIEHDLCRHRAGRSPPESAGVVPSLFVVVDDINDPEVTAVFPQEGYDVLVFGVALVCL
jgi:hypothetical protein